MLGRMALLAATNSAAGATLWTPAQITTALWLDASDSATITTVSGAVSQWNDKSGNARNVVQATAANRPAPISNWSNGLTALSWGSTSNTKSLTWTGSAVTAGPTIAVGVYQGSLPASDFYTLQNWIYTASNDIQLTLQSNGWYSPVFLNGNSTSSFSAGATIQSPFIARGEVNPSTGRTAFYIGSNRDSGGNWRGVVGEVVVPVSTVTTSQLQQIEGYLAWKWGLTANLPAGHPYKSAAPTV